MQVPGTTAVWADFSHIRTVKGRKVCEMIIEAPLEDLLEILKRLGNPVGADCIPVAIAPIDPAAVKAALDVKPAPQAHEVGGSSKPSKPFSSLPLSQQAAIRCSDKTFIDFLNHAFPDLPDDFDPAEAVRKFCCVNSRSDITVGQFTGDRWLELEARYQQYLTDRQYAGSKR